MTTGQANEPGMTWLALAMMTVVAWGVYGVFLYMGTMSMGDPVNGRYKAFLFVGLAYVLTAILAPLAVLFANGASWQMPVSGMGWSLVAGIAGAVGAFCVLLAYGAKGTPAVVMTIVFAGAPIVNAVVATAMHPPAEGWAGIRWQFVLGILLAAVGGGLVTLYRPQPASTPSPRTSVPSDRAVVDTAHAGARKTNPG